MRYIFTPLVLFTFVFTACTNLVPALLLNELETNNNSSVVFGSNSSNPQIHPESENNRPVLLFGIGLHIEPQGTTHQGIKSGKGDYQVQAFFDLHVQQIRTVVDMINRHGGTVTIQAQSPFTDVVIASQNPVLKDLAGTGNEIALHFHEDAHLGKNSSKKSVKQWCTVMLEEMDLVRQASGVETINYWSGGNLYPQLFNAADCAGLSINSDWKNPQSQSTDLRMVGIHPWRPAGGTDGTNFDEISMHDPAGPVIFLPEGLYDREDFASSRRSEETGSDEAYFKYLEQSFLDSLSAAESEKVNVFHFTIHPGEFRGNASHPFEVIEKFLTEVIDPQVRSGKVKWATFSEMADTFVSWETDHPSVDMRD